MEVVGAAASGRSREGLFSASKTVADTSRERAERLVRRVPTFRLSAKRPKVVLQPPPTMLFSSGGKGRASLAGQPHPQRLHGPRVHQTRCAPMELPGDFKH